MVAEIDACRLVNIRQYAFQKTICKWEQTERHLALQKGIRRTSRNYSPIQTYSHSHSLTDARIRTNKNTQIHGYTDTHNANTQIDKHTNKHAKTQTHKYANTQMHEYARTTLSCTWKGRFWQQQGWLRLARRIALNFSTNVLLDGNLAAEIWWYTHKLLNFLLIFNF